MAMLPLKTSRVACYIGWMIGQTLPVTWHDDDDDDGRCRAFWQMQPYSLAPLTAHTFELDEQRTNGTGLLWLIEKTCAFVTGQSVNAGTTNDFATETADQRDLDVGYGARSRRLLVATWSPGG